MGRQWKWRALGLFALVVLSVLMLIPSVVELEDEQGNPTLPEWYTQVFSKRLILGLDLQGGIHLQYKVDIEDALKRKAIQAAGSVQEYLKTEKKLEAKAIAGEGVTLDELTTIKVTLPKAEDAAVIDRTFVRQNAPDFQVSDVTDNVVTLTMSQDTIDAFRDGALEQAIETIERRVNEFGVAESTISRRGESELVVQLPGVKEKEFGAAKEKLAQTGQLHFQMVDREGIGAFLDKVGQRAPKADAWPEDLNAKLKDHITQVSQGRIRSTSREILEYMVKDQYDVEHVVGFEEVFVNPRDPKLEAITNLNPEQEKLLRRQKAFDPDAAVVKAYDLHYLFKLHGMSGENVEDASVGYDQFNRPVVHMRFSQVDAERFFEMTKKFTGELMAIMIDDVVYSAPRIKEPIPGGRVQIEMGAVGGQAQKESQALVAVLKSGALQAPLRKLYDSQVGPSLGSDSIEGGKLAVFWGFGLVAVFMLVYYKGSGFIADFALVLNMLFLMAGLTAFGATLTLPGIAGIVLTIGMAVDANVLIFERIREELRTGVGVRKAIDAGFEKAFSSIFDGNITTVIAAVVLYQFGSGPVRGFAVTLTLGIACSMYTALVVSRLCYDFLYGRGAEPAKLSI